MKYSSQDVLDHTKKDFLRVPSILTYAIVLSTIQIIVKVFFVVFSFMDRYMSHEIHEMNHCFLRFNFIASVGLSPLLIAFCLYVNISLMVKLNHIDISRLEWYFTNECSDPIVNYSFEQVYYGVDYISKLNLSAVIIYSFCLVAQIIITLITFGIIRLHKGEKAIEIEEQLLEGFSPKKEIDHKFES